MASLETTPLAQTARLLDLVPFLLSHQGISLTDLAAHFKVESDVIVDDLNTLWMCGLPGYTPLELIDLAFDSGFVTIRNAAPLAFIRTMSSSEIVSLALGLDLLRDGIAKIGKDQSDRIDRLSQKLRERIGDRISIGPTSETVHRRVIENSIKDRVSVYLTYYSPNSDEETERIVTAYDFFYENNVEYFQAYCHTAQGMRTFRVDRIVAATISEEALEIASTHVENQERIRVGATVRSLDRATGEAFSVPFGELRVGGSITLEAFSPDWLIRAITAGAGSMVVVEPSQIRLQVRQSLDATIALYE
jgi:proteasome accessory factor C